ncbi:NADPH-quinone reductase [Weissella oryzae SG25]|uniref:NADPH-quinone reductase n=1 Tax=Weissella oryzae (strain DSM 25784 / JCM 18191 / LMG 30913 / SG25) TaxID=1329250 RepID=A0A069CSF3_WEIOS|nr:zinc-binding alcohol dehydrogenase family protein [Weissella oryzae]GAK30183.1 NADPH-quinone reductase [Weissella oryzae SG25]
MLSVVQTNFEGIDGLEYKTIDQPSLTPDGVIIKLHLLPVVPTDVKRESDAHATNEHFAALPRTIGVSGVGEVTAVGAKRDQNLLHQRVFVLNPAGSYSEYIQNTEPDWLFVLPDAVSDAASATLTATAITLQEQITQSNEENIVITGANSVIGMYLLQSLVVKENQAVWPVVSAASQQYLATELPNIKTYTVDEVPVKAEDALIIDIAGSEALIETLAEHFTKARVVTIVLMKHEQTADFKFVHEEFAADNYRQLIKQLATGAIKAPIGKIFAVEETKEAQHFMIENHSRGRVLVEFKH